MEAFTTYEEASTWLIQQRKRDGWRELNTLLVVGENRYAISPNPASDRVGQSHITRLKKGTVTWPSKGRIS